jgi:hypothetical protein
MVMDRLMAKPHWRRIMLFKFNYVFGELDSGSASILPGDQQVRVPVMQHPQLVMTSPRGRSADAIPMRPA